MIKLLKTEEERLLEKAKKKKAEQDEIIQGLETKRLERQRVIDAAESDFQRMKQDYESRCKLYSINCDPWTRLCLMIKERDPRLLQSNEMDQLVKQYGLSKFRTFINDLCKDDTPKYPERKKVDPLEN